MIKHKRNRLGWELTLLMLIVYDGYVSLIAFDKAFLAKPIGSCVTTLSIPIALFVIVFTVAITLRYVRCTNNEFDQITKHILKDAQA